MYRHRQKNKYTKRLADNERHTEREKKGFVCLCERDKERKVFDRLKDREKKIVRDRERKDCKRQRKK